MKDIDACLDEGSKSVELFLVRICWPQAPCSMEAAENHYARFMSANKFLFPWGDDTDDEASSGCRAALTSEHESPNVPARTAQTISLAEDGIHYNLIPETKLSGKILQHCLRCVSRLRMATGGEQLCIYKLGITHNCESRFELHKSNGWSKMLVMFASSDLGQIEMLEAAVISHHQTNQQCRNISRGGGGMRTKACSAKFEPPFCCYCTGARADVARWVY